MENPAARYGGPRVPFGTVRPRAKPRGLRNILSSSPSVRISEGDRECRPSEFAHAAHLEISRERSSGKFDAVYKFRWAGSRGPGESNQALGDGDQLGARVRSLSRALTSRCHCAAYGDPSIGICLQIE